MQNNTRIKPTFAIIGLGFISSKHIEAIKKVGGKIIAGSDIDQSKAHKIGDGKFFLNWEDIFEDVETKDVEWVVICTPNNLHYPMTLKAVQLGKKVILEKPAVLKLEHLEELKKYSDQIYNIFQLRFNKELLKFIEKRDSNKEYKANFEVCVHRDDWYFTSWKNDKEQSGGLMFNIGVHYFDILCWLFGQPKKIGLLGNQTDRTAKGIITFKNCVANWKLSIDQPMDNQYRYLEIDGKKIDLSQGFENLHTKIYKEALLGNRIKIEEIEQTIKLLTDYNKI
jgi:UDP-N-acetyl-2-amino-2-deoxyglucuronate dehydrogenase